MNFKPTTELTANRRPVDQVVGKLMSENGAESQEAGLKLMASAKEYGLNIADYLRLAVEPEGKVAELGMDGYEATKVFLGLPTKNDYRNAVTLQAAADAFASYRGVRALFPEVIDDVVQWKYRQTEFETPEALVSQSRTINGTELITTVVQDSEEDYERYGMIGEGGRIPVWSIKASDQSVKIFKFGVGLEWTYEFARRASLDLVTPYVMRAERATKMAQTATAYSLMVNGDGVHGQAPVRDASGVVADNSLDTSGVAAGKINWEVLTAWLVERAKKGAPIDTVAGNWDTYLQWRLMFAKPSVSEGLTQMEMLQRAGVSTAQANPQLDLNINFALVSDASANQLLGFSKNDTVEELIENGSDIEESERVIKNQRVNLYSTKNAGYRLIFGDTREILNLDAIA
tara:strand:+ start:16172 stop:17377 length:1206 start_codon:yes stop_codon:yes gene_type:complete